MHISEMQQKIQKEFSVFQIIAFEVVAEISAYCDRNTCHRQTVLRFMIRVKQSFSNSIYAIFMGKKNNSDALLLSAVFWTSQYVDYRMVFWSKSF